MVERGRPCSPDEVEAGVVEGERGNEELLEAGHADEKEKTHDEHRGGEGGHEEWFAIELLGILDRTLRLERELEIDCHGEGHEGEAEDELDAIANDEGTEEEHGRGSVEEDGDEKRLRGVVLEGRAIGAGEGVVSGFMQLGELAETLERHEVAADHPVSDEKRDRWNEDAGDGVPAEQHAQRVIDGFGEDVEVGNVLGADGWEVVDAAHDPEDEGHEGEHLRYRETDGNACGHHEKPLNVGGGDADQAAGGGAIFLDGMEAIEGRVEDFVDDVVAAGDQGDGHEGEDEGLDEVEIEEGGIDAEGDDDARKNEEVLDGVVEAGDGEVGTKPLAEGYSGGLALRHRPGLPYCGGGDAGSISITCKDLEDVSADVGVGNAQVTSRKCGRYTVTSEAQRRQCIGGTGSTRMNPTEIKTPHE